ncbi:Vacuolar protein sorting-associated protein 41 [Geranomyces variabilis]|uniref:Vacuolar protein sorting-associated protein 41 n=1 Tax=Geranomyces variabilis TaxID=109894 RepID=A0AAD5TI16_9FUNG|nr:Vacuolar protein sorting-associated protein 41 [Geranomyces variabilis]
MPAAPSGSARKPPSVASPAPADSTPPRIRHAPLTDRELQMEALDSPTVDRPSLLDAIDGSVSTSNEHVLLTAELSSVVNPTETVVERAQELAAVTFPKIGSKGAKTEPVAAEEPHSYGDRASDAPMNAGDDVKEAPRVTDSSHEGQSPVSAVQSAMESENNHSGHDEEAGINGTGDDEDEEEDETGEEEEETTEEDEVGEDEPATDLNENDDEEAEEEEEEEGEDDEEEPKLKYQRLASTLGETLKKDAVSTMAVSDRFLALGTHWGVVHILDLIGTDVKRFQCHSATVTALSIDTNGEYVASASDDGKVVINSLYSSEVLLVNYKRPVKAVSLEPDYSKKTTRQFVSGGMAEILTMTGKGWFGNKDVTISSGEGPIYTVQWRGNFIAWANEAGVKIYDVSSQQKIAFIDRPPNSPRADLFRCNLVWKTDYQLLVGWADSVKLCVIKDRSKMDVSSGLPSRYVEIICQFRTDFIVSGIAPLDEDIVLLSFMTDIAESKNVDVIQSGPASRAKSKPPEVHIFTTAGQSVATDVLSLIGFEHYNANDYRLEYLPTDNPAENTFYIVSPKDIVVAKPRTLADHVEWLVERKRYEEALKAAESGKSSLEGNVHVDSIVEIGQKYMETLLSEGRYEEAAATCPKILRADPTLWEEWVTKFSKLQQLPIFYKFIPTSNPQLRPGVYDLVLDALLEANYTMFSETIDSWPPSIYDVSAKVHSVEELLKGDQNNDLLKDIAMRLNSFDKKHDRALFYALVLRRPKALDSVANHNLYAFIQDHALLIMEYDDHILNANVAIMSAIESALLNGSDSSQIFGDIGGNAGLGKVRAATKQDGVQLLVNYPDRISADKVVVQLRKRPKFLHIFLDALFHKDALEGIEFHPLQVELYAEYDYLKLMDFLRISNSYSVEKAYEVCELRDLVPEMVFLLGKMGDNRKALNLIIERLGDVRRAIEFAKEQNDEELWEDLLKYSMDKPSFIVGMLENLGSHINPVRVVERIPNGLEIVGLKDALIKIMTDYGIQLSLRKGCEKILVSDTVELLETLYRAQRRGLILPADVTCSICSLSLEQKAEIDMIVFYCRHSYHELCLVPAEEQVASPSSPSLMRGGTKSAALTPHIENAVRHVYERPNPLPDGRVPIPNLPVSTPGRVITLRRSKPKRFLACPICRNTNKGKLAPSRYE